MSRFDSLLTAWGSAFAGGGSAGSATVTDANFDRWAADGLDMLRPELRAARLADAFDAGRLDDGQKRRVLERLIVAGRAELRGITELLRSGVSTLGRWFNAFRSNVVARNLAAAFGLLGTADPAPADRAALAGQVNRQVDYLARFRDQVKSGEQLLDGTSLSRSELYADAIWATSAAVLLAKMTRDGFTEGKRVRGFGDSCRGCVAAAAAGWLPIDSILPIGDAECRMRCHCYIIYR